MNLRILAQLPSIASQRRRNVIVYHFMMCEDDRAYCGSSFSKLEICSQRHLQRHAIISNCNIIKVPQDYPTNTASHLEFITKEPVPTNSPSNCVPTDFLLIQS